VTIPKTMEAAVVERFAEPLEDEMDLEEALTFAAEGKVKATIETQPLESINDVFVRLKTGKVHGRARISGGIQEVCGSGVNLWSLSDSPRPKCVGAW